MRRGLWRCRPAWRRLWRFAGEPERRWAGLAQSRDGREPSGTQQRLQCPDNQLDTPAHAHRPDTEQARKRLLSVSQFVGCGWLQSFDCVRNFLMVQSNESANGRHIVELNGRGFGEVLVQLIGYCLRLP